MPTVPASSSRVNSRLVVKIENVDATHPTAIVFRRGLAVRGNKAGAIGVTSMLHALRADCDFILSDPTTTKDHAGHEEARAVLALVEAVEKLVAAHVH